MEALVNDLKLAIDTVAFAIELGFTPDLWQARVLRWSGNRFLLNCSRQSGKSTTAAILALHKAIYELDSLILLVSPSLRQSSELFRKVTDLLNKLTISPKKLEGNKLSCTFENRSRIVSLPSSEATIRGFSGANLIIEDEASRVPDELYRAIRPMLAVSGGKLILLSTPFGKRGHFFEEWDKGQGWEKIMIPATECPRISSKFLEEEKQSLGSWWYKQEYLCEFVEAIDQIFSYDLVMQAVSSDVRTISLIGGDINDKRSILS